MCCLFFCLSHVAYVSFLLLSANFVFIVIGGLKGEVTNSREWKEEWNIGKDKVRKLLKKALTVNTTFHVTRCLWEERAK